MTYNQHLVGKSENEVDLIQQRKGHLSSLIVPFNLHSPIYKM